MQIHPRITATMHVSPFTEFATTGYSSTTPSVRTPLGIINTSLKVDDWSSTEVWTASKEGLSSSYRKSHILNWETPSFSLALLSGPFQPKHAAEAHAFIWRVQAKQDLPSLEFTTQLNSKTMKGTPDSGEGLESLAFENAHFRMHIGMESAEFLAARAKKKHWMPKRLATYWADQEESTSGPSWFQYTETGIILRCPPLLFGEGCQFQFLVAWEPASAKDEGKTWLAVETDYRKILSSLL